MQWQTWRKERGESYSLVHMPACTYLIASKQMHHSAIPAPGRYARTTLTAIRYETRFPGRRVRLKLHSAKPHPKLLRPWRYSCRAFSSKSQPIISIRRIDYSDSPVQYQICLVDPVLVRSGCSRLVEIPSISTPYINASARLLPCRFQICKVD